MLLTQNSMETFNSITKPGLAPPGWLFPVVWTILYILMGIASYLVLTSGKPNNYALTVYGIQLVINFFWSIIFFNLELYLFACFLIGIRISMTVLFYTYKKRRISATSFSSTFINRFAISLVFSSAALYWFKYLLRDFTPILQPSVIKSAIVSSDSSITSFIFVFTHDMLFAIGLGSFPSS
ncbi:MAG: tryptophan-rich sensory protein [Lachnospiraceae bacterium]|nr:tryptophan-rich sensory protein [Lachnospiraceae bacterium]